MRLIDADKLSKEIKAECNPYGKPTIIFEDGLKVLGIIDRQPTVTERTGHWIVDGHHRRCNICETFTCMTDREGDSIPSNYCPNCGADMRGKS